MATNFYFQKATDVLPIDIESTFNVRVTQVRGLNPSSPKGLFTRDWANENGVDVYLPETRYVKSKEVTMTFFATSTATKTAIQLYDDICAYMIGDEFDYWDTLQNKKVGLIYIDNKTEWYQFITPQKVMFEITLLNKTGERTDV